MASNRAVIEIDLDDAWMLERDPANTVRVILEAVRSPKYVGEDIGLGMRLVSTDHIADPPPSATGA